MLKLAEQIQNDLLAKYVNHTKSSAWDIIPKNNFSLRHEHIRTLEEIVVRDKGGMIFSPIIGLHENVVVLDYDSEYANLILMHNLSYETVVYPQSVIQTTDKGLLPKVIEKVLKRRLYFKEIKQKFFMVLLARSGIDIATY